MKVLYLAAGRAELKHSGVVYNDLFEDRDLKCDMLSVDLDNYDVLIATPPCNFYSRARGNNPPSEYALGTKNLLPTIIQKFLKSGKPFIVEKLGLYNFNCLVYKHGRHTYWTNILINFSNIPQVFEFKSTKGRHCSRLKSYCQGGKNVNDCFDYFLDVVEEIVNI